MSEKKRVIHICVDLSVQPGSLEDCKQADHAGNKTRRRVKGADTK